MGLSYTGTMCDEKYNAGVNEDRGSWQFTVETLAHELGHNWGMAHDSQGNSCSSSGFIMNRCTRKFHSALARTQMHAQIDMRSRVYTH